MQRQLDIFSPQEELQALAWQLLSDFDFENAIGRFQEVLETEPGHPEAAEGLKTAERWMHYGLSAPASIDALKFRDDIFNTSFPQSWGGDLFRKKLMGLLFSIMSQRKIFELDDQTDIADICVQMGQLEMAENALKTMLSGNASPARLLARLADIRWLRENYAEARKNYLQALLTDPFSINTEKIASPVLKAVIKTHGTDKAPAWCWVYGEKLTGIALDDLAGSPEKADSAGAVLFFALREAEIANSKHESRRTLARKKLMEADPALYRAYFNILQTGEFYPVEKGPEK